MLVCFDIDGTLADVSHRVHYWREKPRNWNKFKSEMINDPPIEPVCKVARVMGNSGIDVIVCSGRSEDTRDMTHSWLQRNGIYYSKLYMRAEKDYRADDIVKRELLDQIISDWGKKPDIVFDDRPRVVKMWRDSGIFVADVYQGEEDF